jgi:protein-S-isoprenylcysteine O-methyltransferase Ste14
MYKELSVVSKVALSFIALLIGIAIFVGLPLIGWGVADVQGFISHPARLGYVMLVILLEVFVVIKFPGAGSQHGEGTKTVHRQRWTVLLMQVLSLAIVIAAAYSDRHDVSVMGTSDLVRYLGLVLFACGFVMMNWAAASLGKQFSVQVTLQADHQLVTGGPYRRLRHPRYLGIIVFNAGIALIFHSWLALQLTGVLTVVLLWRIHDEEAFMHQAFGAKWETYTSQSWRLVPFVY